MFQILATQKLQPMQLSEFVFIVYKKFCHIFYISRIYTTYNSDNTVRLKYDDTHYDQKFFEILLYPLIAWKRLRTEGGRVNFQRISSQNGCHHVWVAP